MTGRTLACVVRPTQATPDRDVILGEIASLVEGVCHEGGAKTSTLTAGGVGLRGIVDVQTGKALGWPNTPAWAPTWIGLDVGSIGHGDWLSPHRDCTIILSE